MKGNFNETFLLTKLGDGHYESPPVMVGETTKQQYNNNNMGILKPVGPLPRLKVKISTFL